MIIKERDGLNCEPMSVAIYQIARETLDRVIYEMQDPTARFKIKIRDAGVQKPQSHVAVHTYYFPMSNKVFIEYDISKDMKSLLKDAWTELDKFIKGTLHAMYFENSIHTWPEIINPEDSFDHSTDGNYILTPYTIGYWRTMFGRYQLLEDKAMINHWKSEYTITHPKFDWNIYHRQVHAINEQYGLHQDHWQNIPDAFADYNELFKEYFNRDLTIAIYPQMPGTDWQDFDYDFFDIEETEVRTQKDFSFDPTYYPEHYIYINIITKAEMRADNNL